MLHALAPDLTLSDTIKGRNDYGAVRMANVETRSLKREERRTTSWARSSSSPHTTATS
jgi:hypothetical protein